MPLAYDFILLLAVYLAVSCLYYCLLSVLLPSVFLAAYWQSCSSYVSSFLLSILPLLTVLQLVINFAVCCFVLLLPIFQLAAYPSACCVSHSMLSIFLLPPILLLAVHFLAFRLQRAPSPSLSTRLAQAASFIYCYLLSYLAACRLSCSVQSFLQLAILSAACCQ